MTLYNPLQAVPEKSDAEWIAEIKASGKKWFIVTLDGLNAMENAGLHPVVHQWQIAKLYNHQEHEWMLVRIGWHDRQSQ